MENKKCPLTKNDCIKKDCEWWATIKLAEILEYKNNLPVHKVKQGCSLRLIAEKTKDKEPKVPDFI